MAAAFAKLKSEEPVIIAAAPKQIKGAFTTEFNYFNKFYGELAAVKYNYFKIPPTFYLSIASSAATFTAAARTITSYLIKNCGIKNG